MQKRTSRLALAFSAAAFLGTSIASATVFNYSVNLNGASENPANGSPATGSGSVVYDDAAHTLALQLSFSGLTGTTTASHLHAVTATSGLGGNAAAAAVTNVGVASTTPSFALFPLGVTSGSFSNTLDLTQASSWNASFVTAQGGLAGAEAAMAGALAAGKTYWNVHTSAFPGGEIRGFPVAVPEPTCVAAFAFSSLGLLIRRRK